VVAVAVVLMSAALEVEVLEVEVLEVGNKPLFSPGLRLWVLPLTLRQ
jgi:hypothetical protein